MIIKLNWDKIKEVITEKRLFLQYIDLGKSYHIATADGPFKYSCELEKDGGTDVTDFEDNYKADSNRPQTVAQSATVSNFCAKQIVIPSGVLPSGICEWEYDTNVYLNKMLAVPVDAEWGDYVNIGVNLKANDYEVAQYASDIYLYGDKPDVWFQGNGAGKIPNYCKVRCTYVKGDNTTDAERKFIVIAEFLI